jgi:hypothetical protein
MGHQTAGRTAELVASRFALKPGHPELVLFCNVAWKIAIPEEQTMASVTTKRETASLIGSDKVEGTAVYGADEQRIGTIQRVMIDKISGKVAFAVTSFGGFLGIGEDYYPVPWPSLKYDTGLGGYRTGITINQLEGAPKYGRNTDWDWDDRARDRQVYDYYHAPLWY